MSSPPSSTTTDREISPPFSPSYLPSLPLPPFFLMSFSNRNQQISFSYPTIRVSDGLCILELTLVFFYLMRGWEPNDGIARFIRLMCYLSCYLHNISNYLRPTRRAVVEFEIENGDCSMFTPQVAGVPRKYAIIQRGLKVLELKLML
ncbi:hypothetical protein L1987_09333 [Smallanthus sonchifolius]|uniref:Uncharacterized protein n=1 Tax=Smallanthus sonchifolius TaxID=185202 RepID=A0ACB9JPF7_9ASTR|nr:hypothetical protein L1987_09333 [Smallanthus sonchifolius]